MKAPSQPTVRGTVITRRRLLLASGVMGGGLVVGVSLLGPGARRDLPVLEASEAFTPNAFIQITPDNVVRFYCPRDEMGQGITTGLATLVAEELDVRPEAIEIHLAGVHEAYDNPELGSQSTGGSTSIKGHYLPVRQAAANARALILEAASRDLGVAPGSLTTADGHVRSGDAVHPYGRFAVRARDLKRDADAPLKARESFKVIGTDFPRLDGLAKATGTARFGIDVDVPDMVHAVVLRCPVAGGTLAGFNPGPARARPGVVDVLQISSGVAVVARTFWQASRAAAAVEVDWHLPALARRSSADIEAEHRARLAEEPGEVAEDRGDLDAGFRQSEVVVEARYWTPFLAHAPMEPMNAVVRIAGDEADVWSGTQSPAVARGLVARAAGLDVDRVRVHSTYLGGGFGRRVTLTHVAEAAELAVLVGRPVKVIWTREDDLRHGVVRPASLLHLEAGVDGDGRIAVWRARRAGGNVLPGFLAGLLPGVAPGMPDTLVRWGGGAARTLFDGWTVDPLSVEGLLQDYDLPNAEVRHVTVDAGLPLSFWRSVGHSYTAFAKECFIDELAAAAHRDPVEFRLANSTGTPRMNHVIAVAGERMRALAEAGPRHLGLAAHASFGSFVAQVAEVSVADGRIRVHRVVCVIDCGQVVNPDMVRTQMEGGIVFGLTAALHGELSIEGGTIAQSNFHDYPLLRMDESPDIEVVIVDSDEPPTGVGEPGLPPIAPAVANAVFAGTGQRLRRLPLRLA